MVGERRGGDSSRNEVELDEFDSLYFFRRLVGGFRCWLEAALASN